MAVPPQKILAIEDLCLSIGGRKLLSSINLSIDSGRICALMGPSGSGKSLTALSIARLLPQCTQLSGRIVFGGVDALGLCEKELCKLRGKDISYVFQEPMACFNPSIAVGRQLLECLQIHGGCGKKSMKEIVLRWFRDLQVQDPERAYGSYCHELSGGMLQRAMLAMALINGPRLLIADEPTSALDDESCRAAIGQLLRLQRQLNFAVLFITHDRKLGESIAHCTASMEDGKIVSNT